MSVYFSRGPKQENAGPIIQVHSGDSSFNSPVGAVNYQGKKASPNNWIDVVTLTVNKKSNNSIMHLSMRGDCQANTSAYDLGVSSFTASGTYTANQQYSNLKAVEVVEVTVSRNSDLNTSATINGNPYILFNTVETEVIYTAYNVQTQYLITFGGSFRDAQITNNGKTLGVDDDNSSTNPNDWDDDYNDLMLTVNKGRFFESGGSYYYILDIESEITGNGQATFNVNVDSSGNPTVTVGNNTGSGYATGDTLALWASQVGGTQDIIVTVDIYQRGAAGIRVARDSGSGNPDDATTVIDLGAAQPSLDPAYDTVSFSHFFMDQGVSAGTSRYRLQLQCNRAVGNNNNVQINANAQASLEVIEAGDVISSS